MNRRIIGCMGIVLIALYGLAGCSGDSGGGDGTVDTGSLSPAQGDSGPSTSNDSGGSPPPPGESDAGTAPLPPADDAGAVAPPPEEVPLCDDPESIDLAAIQANPTFRLNRLGIGGFDATQPMFCDETSSGDVDGDAATSFPDSSIQSTVKCNDGLDNALLYIMEFVGNLLDDPRGLVGENVADGSLNIVVEFAGDTASPFTVNLYNGGLEADNTYNETTAAWNTCDINNSELNCNYELDPESFNEDCESLIAIDDVTISDEAGVRVLSGGGPDAIFQLTIPLEDIGALALQIGAVNLRAVVHEDAAGNITKLTGGLITGVLPEEALAAALEAAGDLLAGFGPVIAQAIPKDIDTDGDGEGDAISVGIMFEAGPGTVVGITGVDTPTPTPTGSDAGSTEAADAGSSAAD